MKRPKISMGDRGVRAVCRRSVRGSARSGGWTERLGRHLPPGLKTWCYEKKEGLRALRAMEGGLRSTRADVSPEQVAALLAHAREGVHPNVFVVMVSLCRTGRCAEDRAVREWVAALRRARIPFLCARSARWFRHRSAATPLVASELNVPIDQALDLLTAWGACPVDGAQGVLAIATPMAELCKRLGRFHAQGWISVYCADAMGPRAVSRMPAGRSGAWAKTFLAQQCDVSVRSVAAREERVGEDDAVGTERFAITNTDGRSVPGLPRAPMQLVDLFAAVRRAEVRNTPVRLLARPAP